MPELTQEEFLAPVVARNTTPQGQLRDPELLSRMQNPVCQGCHAKYREKYPSTPFQIKCRGIYGEQELIQIAARSEVDIADVREIYDPVYWANKHIKVPDDDGMMQPFVARDYQEEILLCTASQKVDRCARGLGKALAIDTPIPTPSGFKPMKDVQVGDVVFDDCGRPANVTFVSEIQHGRTCYDVHFIDGSVITADADHLWEVWSAKQLKKVRTHGKSGRPKIASTAQILSEMRGRYYPSVRTQIAPAEAVLLSNVGDFSTRRGQFIPIMQITPRVSVPVKCIQVDSPSHLYLAGRSFIPTHNTSLGIIEELHHLFTRQNYDILFCSPHKSQVMVWYNAVLGHCKADPELKACVADHKQQPYPVILLTNGSKIGFFTIGSSSGKKGDSIRTQSPRRVRIDEQDLLAEEDYSAIGPLLVRYKNSEFHGSSTPTGKLAMYYHMCTKDPGKREFHFPIMCHPEWGPEMEAECRREAPTEERWEHEFLAGWGSLAEGVFKKKFLDRAKVDYPYCACRGNDHLRDCPQPYNRDWIYMIGVDWNSSQNGTSIRVVGLDPHDRKKKMVQVVTIGDTEFTHHRAVEEVIQANRRWHASIVLIDKGYGHMQDETLRLVGHNARTAAQGSSPYKFDDVHLLDLKVVDFGASLETNSLVPGDPKETKRRTKPYIVEEAQIALERGEVWLSYSDQVLSDQMSAYRVKAWDANGRPRSFECVEGIADHDLTSWILALLGFSLASGDEFNKRYLSATIQAVSNGGPPRLAEVAQRPAPPSRQLQPQEFDPIKVLSVNTGPSPSYVIAPNKKPANTGSRTAAFGKAGPRIPFGYGR